MRIAFKERAIHKRTGISLITVADHVLRLPCGICDELPFTSCWEAGASAPAQPGVRNHFDHFIRLHLREHYAQGFIPVGSDVLLNAFRIDSPAILEDHLYLFLEEWDLLLALHNPASLRVLP